MKKIEHLMGMLAQMRTNLETAETLTASEREFMQAVHDILEKLLTETGEDIATMQAELIRLRQENEQLKAWFDDIEIDGAPYRIQ